MLIIRQSSQRYYRQKTTNKVQSDIPRPHTPPLYHNHSTSPQASPYTQTTTCYRYQTPSTCLVNIRRTRERHALVMLCRQEFRRVKKAVLRKRDRVFIGCCGKDMMRRELGGAVRYRTLNPCSAKNANTAASSNAVHLNSKGAHAFQCFRAAFQYFQLRTLYVYLDKIGRRRETVKGTGFNLYGKIPFACDQVIEEEPLCSCRPIQSCVVPCLVSEIKHNYRMKTTRYLRVS